MENEGSVLGWSGVERKLAKQLCQSTAQAYRRGRKLGCWLKTWFCAMCLERDGDERERERGRFRGEGGERPRANLTLGKPSSGAHLHQINQLRKPRRPLQIYRAQTSDVQLAPASFNRSAKRGPSFCTKSLTFCTLTEAHQPQAAFAVFSASVIANRGYCFSAKILGSALLREMKRSTR